MVDQDKILNIPLSERQYMTGPLRAKLVAEIFSQYKKRFDRLKMIYGIVNRNGQIPVDYAAIFTVVSNGNVKLIIIDVAYAYGERSTPGYRWCKIHHKEDDYFKEVGSHLAQMTEASFHASIVDNMHLSLDKDDPLYWKNPDNVDALAKGLSDLYIKFKKPKKM